MNPLGVDEHGSLAPFLFSTQLFCMGLIVAPKNENCEVFIRIEFLREEK